MRGVAVDAVLVALALPAVAGCGSRFYHQPSDREPHARIAIRFDHGSRTDSGPIDEFIWVDGDPIEMIVAEDHVLRLNVTPGRTQLVFKTMRYHEEEGLAIVHRGGYGPVGSPTHDRRTSYVPITDHVGEAGCTARLTLPMHDGDTYLLLYSYVSPEECTVECRRAVRGEDGQARAVPCDESATAAEAPE